MICSHIVQSRKLSFISYSLNQSATLFSVASFSSLLSINNKLMLLNPKSAMQIFRTFYDLTFAKSTHAVCILLNQQAHVYTYRRILYATYTSF